MMLSVLRRGVPLAALTGVLALSLLACGAEHTTTTEARSKPSPSTSSATPHSATPSPTTKAPPMSSSIILRRTGGIAGFKDVLTVDHDGKVTFTSRARKSVTCTVNPKVKAELESAAAAAAESPAPRRKSDKGRLKGRTTNPDAMHLSLTIGDLEVRFEDLDSDASAYHRLFNLMNSVMASAESIRAGKKPPAGSACSA